MLASMSSSPSSSKGVTIAVSTAPNGAPLTAATPCSLGGSAPAPQRTRLAGARSSAGVAASRQRLLAPVDAERVQQVLVQLEPHGVVRVDHRLREPVVLAGAHSIERGAQPWPVPVVAQELPLEILEQRFEPHVQIVQVVDDAAVVRGVVVRVERRFVLHLPCGAHTEQLRVEVEEA